MFIVSSFFINELPNFKKFSGVRFVSGTLDNVNPVRQMPHLLCGVFWFLEIHVVGEFERIRIEKIYKSKYLESVLKYLELSLH